MATCSFLPTSLACDRRRNDEGGRTNARLGLVCLVILGLACVIAHAEGGDVEIKWHGHAIFTIAFKGGPTVLTDPFEPGLWDMTYPIGPMDGIDVVAISHEHGDHNYAQLATGDPLVLRGVSTSRVVVDIDDVVDGIRFYTVETCHGTDVPCPPEDANAVFVIEGNGLRIAHLGDLGHVLTDAQASAIGMLDVLLIPVGGGGATIEARRANEVIAQLKPLVIIAMHHETPDLRWGIETIDRFLIDKTVVEVGERSLVINANMLPAEPTVVCASVQVDGRSNRTPGAARPLISDSRIRRPSRRVKARPETRRPQEACDRVGRSGCPQEPPQA
ncbi:MAG: MBL fold metallo-hydrolase [Candidatus Bipolaricaulia bacterium]